MASDRFAADIVPTLLFGAFVNVRNYYAVPSSFVLQTPATPGPLYLRAPCSAAEAVEVHPWWSLESTVTVCPDAYRPDKWTVLPSDDAHLTTAVIECDSQVGSPELETKAVCGCGPNLIRCLRDAAQYTALSKSLMNEVKQTTAYVVTHDLPMASLFTGNSTFRDRDVERFYRRQQIGSLESTDVEQQLADLGSWPEAGQWAPRPELRPGQHAGVLTTPQILHWLPDRRQRQRGYYEMLWCNMRNSFGATTHKVLELASTGNNLFVNAAWERLAHTELCTNCHARLDYGSRFFNGYPDSRASVHYVPTLQSTETGPLYGRDIDDLRGTGPLTPLGFAKLATTQPDFGSCMTTHFASYVLGDDATAEDVQAIQAAVEHAGTFKAAMTVALERLATHWRAARAPEAPDQAPESAASPTVVSTAPVAPGLVALSPTLRRALDEGCGDCHDHTAAPYTADPDADLKAFDFSAPALPRKLLVTMTEQVAYQVMPKDQLLPGATREAIVAGLIDTLWPDRAARDEARSYYLGRARGLPAQQLDNSIHAIDRAAGGESGIAWGALERGIWSDQSTITPGFLAMTNLEALRACTVPRPGRMDSLQTCLTASTGVQSLSRWPLPTAPPDATP